MKRLISAAVLAATSITLMAGPAMAVPADIVNVGSCTARGDFATCVASGNVNHPIRLYVHVAATPNQHVSGAWDVVCSKGTGAGSKSGTFSGSTPIRHQLTMPYTRPDSCTVAADAQLGGSGSLHVWITAWDGLP